VSAPPQRCFFKQFGGINGRNFVRMGPFLSMYEIVEQFSLRAENNPELESNRSGQEDADA